MDILLIARCPPYPLDQGERLAMYQLARTLAERHHHLDLIAFYQRPEDAADIPRYERFFHHIRLVREPLRAFGHVRQRLKSREFFPKSAASAWSAEMWRAIEERMRAMPYDVIQFFGGIEVYEYRELVAARPHVIVLHESATLTMKHQATQSTGSALQRMRDQRRLWLNQEYERRMFAGFSRVIVPSQADLDALQALNPENTRLTVIPPGVDTDYFAPTGVEPDRPNIIFTGNYDEPESLDAAMRLVRHIFPAIRQRVPDAQLFLIGANPPAALNTYRGKEITITGRVPDIRPWLDRGLIYLSPLRGGSGVHHRILEAMAMQKTVIATARSVSGIAIRNEQHALIAESDEELMRAVVRAVKERPLRRAIAQSARLLVEERYTWRKIAERYEQVYKEIRK